MPTAGENTLLHEPLDGAAAFANVSASLAEVTRAAAEDDAVGALVISLFGVAFASEDKREGVRNARWTRTS